MSDPLAKPKFATTLNDGTYRTPQSFSLSKENPKFEFGSGEKFDVTGLNNAFSNSNSKFIAEILPNGYMHFTVENFMYNPEGSVVTDEGEYINSSYMVIENDLNGDGNITPIIDGVNPIDTNSKNSVINSFSQSSVDGETRIVYPHTASFDYPWTKGFRWGQKTASDPQYLRFMKNYNNRNYYFDFEKFPPLYIALITVGFIWFIGLSTIGIVELVQRKKKN